MPESIVCIFCRAGVKIDAGVYTCLSHYPHHFTFANWQALHWHWQAIDSLHCVWLPESTHWSHNLYTYQIAQYTVNDYDSWMAVEQEANWQREHVDSHPQNRMARWQSVVKRSCQKFYQQVVEEADIDLRMADWYPGYGLLERYFASLLGLEFIVEYGKFVTIVPKAT